MSYQRIPLKNSKMLSAQSSSKKGKETNTELNETLSSSFDKMQECLRFGVFFFHLAFYLSIHFVHSKKNYCLLARLYGFDFFGKEPKAEITVPFVPVILVVIKLVGFITVGCCTVTALGNG